MTTQNRELASLIDSSGNVTATGNLTVSGTTTAVSSTNTTVTDPLIELNNGAGSNSNDLGFVFERGSTGNNACLIWDESNDAFAVGTTTATGTSTGNMSYTTGDFLAGKVTVDNVIINGTTIGHTDDTDLITFADGALTVAGTIASTGVVTANAGVVVDNITIDGTEIDLSSGDLTLDVAGRIDLSADDNGEIRLYDGSSMYAVIKDDDDRLSIEGKIQDKNILFVVNDGGSATTALQIAADNGGQLLAAPLGVANPTYSFSGDSNTGMTRPTGDTLQMICNGSQAMRITETLVTIAAGHISMADSAGNVSVGHEALNVVQANSGDSNTAMGYQALEKVTDGIHNTGMGYRTGMEITTGSQNVLMGNFAGDAITTGTENTALGYGSLTACTTGAANTAVGYAAAQNLTEGTLNVAVGNQALTAITTGSGNVAIGREALDANTTAGYNVAIGTSALSANTTAQNNTAVGTNALAANTTGAENTALGRESLEANTTASNNTAVGRKALEATQTGHSNTAVGETAGQSITNSGNTAIGREAMQLGTGGEDNVAVGYRALQDCAGDNNVGIGRNSLLQLTSGGGNVAVGQMSGQDLTSGSTNTFVGVRSGQNITTASNNTAMGVDSMEDATTAADNTCIGNNAGANLTSGSNNTLIGKETGKSGMPGGQFTSHSNRVVLGNNSIQEFNCQVALSVASDERDKTDFTNLNIGLDFVKQMKPYTYKWDKRSKYVDWDTNPNTDLNTITNDGTHKETQLDIGFKAQDVEILEKAAGYDKDNNTNLTINLSEDGKQYSMKYEKLVPVLVKAIQELEARVATLES